MAEETLIIRKPLRNYPLPKNIRELDDPWPSVIEARHHRVDYKREGYDKNKEGCNNPMIIPPSGYDSDLLSKL